MIKKLTSIFALIAVVLCCYAQESPKGQEPAKQQTVEKTPTSQKKVETVNNSRMMSSSSSERREVKVNTQNSSRMASRQGTSERKNMPAADQQSERMMGKTKQPE